RSTIGDEEILAVPGLTIRVQCTGCTRTPHPHAANLVNDRAAGGDAVPLLLARHARVDHSTHLLQQAPERLLHVLDLEQFVITALPVEAQHRNSPLVDYPGIEFTIGVFVRDHLAPAGES